MVTLRILLLAVLALGGCSTVQVSQDYDPRADFRRYATWQWRDPVQPPTGDIRADSPLLDQRIRQAVENHLVARSIKPAREQPDLYLAYHLVIEPKIYGDTYGSTMGAGGFYHPWYGGFGSDTPIRQYDESRLTIDMVAPHTDQLLWRGTGVYRFKAYATPEQSAAALQEIVDRILGQFPPVGH
jgi:hypothetical protein